MSKIEGLEEVLDSFDSLADTSGYKSALEKACALVEASAKKAAPKDSGELRCSITSKIDESNGEIQGIVFTPLEYAPYRYVRSINRAKSGKPKQLKYHTI